MKIIYSRWDPDMKRWRNKPAQQIGTMALICAKDDHSGCLHGTDTASSRDYVFTDTVALRSTMIQSVLFTKETVIIKLVPRKNGNNKP